MRSLTLSAIQMTSTSSWKDNLAYAVRSIHRAAADGAKLVILPENALLFNGPGMRDLSESVAQEEIRFVLQEAAVSNGVWLVVGSHPSINRPDGQIVEGKRVRQSCLVISPQGEWVARYDKIHLFDVDVDDKTGSYRESDYIEPGDIEPTVCAIEGVQVGLSICYDLRFPELYRRLSAAGAELILVPAAFTYKTGEAHWHTLLKARAIENQVYMVGVNQCGYHNPNRQTFGHTLCYSPWGGLVGELREEPGLLTVTIGPEELEMCRKKMPVLKHRRLY